jgi:hypothetical protein
VSNHPDATIQRDHHERHDYDPQRFALGVEQPGGGIDHALTSQRGKVRVGRLDEQDAAEARQAPQRHVGEKADHEEIDQRAQVPAAEANQGAVAAGADQGHAETEAQPAQNGAQPAEIGNQVDRLLDIDEPGQVHALGRERRGRDCQGPGAEALMVGPDEGIGDGAQSAKVHRPGGDAHDRAADKGESGDHRGYRQAIHDQIPSHTSALTTTFPSGFRAPKRRPPSLGRGSHTASPAVRFLARRCAEQLIQQIDDLACVVAGQRIVDRLAVAPMIYEVVRAQACELLRDRRLPQVQQTLELGDGFLAAGQEAEQQEPVLVGQGL